MRTWRRRLALLPAVALATSGCFGGSNSAASFPPEIGIGVLAPQSGPNKDAGIDSVRGAQLAADLINSNNPGITLPLASGIGLPNLGGARIKIVAKDTQGDDQLGADETTALVTDDHVSALVGAFDPDVTQAASQRAERLQVPFINADSSATFLTERGLDWYFGLGPSVRTTGEAFFSLLQRQAKAGKQTKNIALLYTADRAGNDVATVVSELADEGQYRLLSLGVSPGSGDFTGAITKLQAARPNAVFVVVASAAMPTLLANFATQATTYTPDAIFAFRSGFLAPSVTQQAGPAITGVCREATWSYELASRNAVGRAVVQLYQKKYNTAMTDEAATSFTAVLTTAQGINAAGSTAAQAIRSGLLALDIPGDQTIMPWKGVQFDETHQNTNAQSIVEQFVDRSFHPIFPVDASSRSFAWPASSAATAGPA